MHWRLVLLILGAGCAMRQSAASDAVPEPGSPWYLGEDYAPSPEEAAQWLSRQQYENLWRAWPIMVTIHPSVATSPLQARLLFTEEELQPGNAAVHYLRAASLLESSLPEPPHREHGPSVQKKDEKDDAPADLETWLQADLDDWPGEEVQTFLDAVKAEHIFAEVKRGARCASCHWRYTFEEGTDPPALRFRRLVQLVILMSWHQIARGETLDVFDAIRVSLSFARHLAQSPFASDYAEACALTFLVLLEFHRTPEGPLLDEALAKLPTPYLPAVSSVEAQALRWFEVWPALKNPEHHPKAPEQLGRLLQEHWCTFLSLPADPQDVASAGMTALVAIKLYPEARRFLLQMGHSAEDITRMDPVRACAVHAVHERRELARQLRRLLLLPPHDQTEAMDVLVTMDESIQFWMWQPSWRGILLQDLRACTRMVRMQRRIDRHIALHRCVNLLRRYAAVHGGDLPDRLNQLAAPPPVDPLTATPFRYRRTAQGALLYAPPAPPFWHEDALRCEVTVAPCTAGGGDADDEK